MKYWKPIFLLTWLRHWSCKLLLVTVKFTKVTLEHRSGANSTWNDMCKLAMFVTKLRLKPTCSATEANLGLEIFGITSIDIILSRERTTKTLIRLHGCVGWSASLLFPYGIRQVFSWCGSNYRLMDGWVRVLHPFNSISGWWKGEHERLCAMKRCLGSGRISPLAGFEPTTLWSEVRSANCSAMRTLLKLQVHVIIFSAFT